MSTLFLRPGANPSLYGCLLLFALVSIPLLSQTTIGGSSANINAAQTSQPMQSDAAAIQAMQNVIVKSGGLSNWATLRSAEEQFSVYDAESKTTRVIKLLDDWSSDTTRYRRGLQGPTWPSDGPQWDFHLFTESD